MVTDGSDVVDGADIDNLEVSIGRRRRLQQQNQQQQQHQQHQPPQQHCRLSHLRQQHRQFSSSSTPSLVLIGKEQASGENSQESAEENAAHSAQSTDEHNDWFGTILTDVKFWCFFLLETIVRLMWRSICRIGAYAKRYFMESFMSSYLGMFLLKLRELIFNDSLQRQRLLDWLEEILPSRMVPKNFTTDWENGVLLCALVDSIVPGTCPRHDLLDTLPASMNILLGLNLVETCFDIKIRISPQELLESSKNSERKWIQLLSQIRLSHSKQQLPLSCMVLRRDSLRNNFAKQPYFVAASEFFNRCFLRGTGIVHGVRSRPCCFAIYYDSDFVQFSPCHEDFFILHVELLGPNDSYCAKQVRVADLHLIDENNNTVENSSTMKINKFKNRGQQTLLMKAANELRGKFRHIPLFFTVFKTHIRVEYIPIYIGPHTLNIVWQGQHVLGSPFHPDIQSSCYIERKQTEVESPKIEPGFRYPLTLLPGHNNSDLDKYATVVARKVLNKRIVHRGIEYDYEDYFDRIFKNHPIDIDRRILEANYSKLESATPTTTSPNTPLPFVNVSDHDKENFDDDISIELIWNDIESSISDNPDNSEHSGTISSSTSSTKSLKTRMKNNSNKLKKLTQKALTLGKTKKKTN